MAVISEQETPNPALIQITPEHVMADSILQDPSTSISFVQFVGFVATVTTIGQFLSGSLTARRVWLMGNTGDLSPVPFMASVLGSTLWFLYGIQLRDTTLIYTNLSGIVLNGLYVLVFYFYSTRKNWIARQIISIFTVITLVYIYINSFEEAEIARNRLGLICTSVAFTVCASPLVALKHVVRTKSSDSLPFPLISSMCAVCALWWLYGFLINDFYMQVTNSFGTCIAGIQLTLFFIYPSSADHHDKGYKRTIPM